MKVLVGFDGSEGAYDAVELARRLAGGEPGEALLVNVLPYPGPLPAAYYLLGYEEAEWAHDFFAGASSTLAPLEVRWANYVGGSPAQILTDRAVEEHFDLMVIGSPHRGAVGRTLLGSVAQGVLHGAPLAVAVAPRGYAQKEEGELRKIAVAYDGTPEAGLALERAVSLARRQEATIDLLTVATIPPPAPKLVGFRLDPQQRPGEVIEQGLDAIGADIEAHGRELRGGSIASALAAACEDADLLAIGSRRYGFLARVMVGSVSTEVIHSAPCPVLVAPRPADEVGT